MHLSVFHRKYPYPHRPGYVVVTSTIRGSLLIVSEKVYQAAAEGKLPENQAAVLAEAGILVPDTAAEVARMPHFCEDVDRKGQEVTLVVVMNVECNLNCLYCYEGVLKGNGKRMTAETAAETARFVTEHIFANGKDCHINFTGGEPLLSLDILKNLTRQLRNEATSRGRIFTFSLVTNGTLLTRKTVLELQEIGLLGARVTLDGPPDMHDRSRPYINGKGSFRDILENVRNCYDLIAISLGGNFYEHTYRRFPEILDLLLEEGFDPQGFREVTFGAIVKTPNAPPELLDPGCTDDDPWVAGATLFLRQETIDRGFPVGRVGSCPCIIDLSLSWVVNWDGGLYKCPAVVGNEKFRAGHVSEERTDIGMYRPARWNVDRCLSCPKLPLCFGGCRYSDIAKTGVVDDAPVCRADVQEPFLEKMILQDVEMLYGGKT